MESSENDNAVSRTSHKPWKSLPRFPHSPRPDDYEKNMKSSPQGAVPDALPTKAPSGSFPDWKRLGECPRVLACLIHEVAARSKNEWRDLAEGGSNRVGFAL